MLPLLAVQFDDGLRNTLRFALILTRRFSFEILTAISREQFFLYSITVLNFLLVSAQLSSSSHVSIVRSWMISLDLIIILSFVGSRKCPWLLRMGLFFRCVRVNSSAPSMGQQSTCHALCWMMMRSAISEGDDDVSRGLIVSREMCLLSSVCFLLVNLLF